MTINWKFVGKVLIVIENYANSIDRVHPWVWRALCITGIPSIIPPPCFGSVAKQGGGIIQIPPKSPKNFRLRRKVLRNKRVLSRRGRGYNGRNSSDTFSFCFGLGNLFDNFWQICWIFENELPNFSNLWKYIFRKSMECKRKLRYLKQKTIGTI